jgi:hypothetical protein
LIDDDQGSLALREAQGQIASEQHSLGVYKLMEAIMAINMEFLHWTAILILGEGMAKAFLQRILF